MKNRARDAYDDSAIREALQQPVEIRVKPPIARVDPLVVPKMSDRGFRPVPSQPKRRRSDDFD